MKMPKKPYMIAIGVLVCVAAGLAVSHLVFGNASGTATGSQYEVPADERLLYTIKKGSLPLEIDIDGISEPCQTTILSFLSDGIVKAVYRQEGDFVKKGELIAELETAAVRLELLQIDKELEQARVTGSRRDVEIQDLKRKITLSELEHTRLVAPYDGYLAEFTLEPNAKAGTGTEIGTFYDLSALEAKLDINEMDINKIAIGNRVEVSFNALPTETFSGKIKGISRKFENQDGIISYKATAVFENLPPVVRPGFNFTGKIVYGTKETAIIVPRLAISQEGHRYYVSLVEQSKTVKRFVKIGLATDNFYEILDGLQEGEKIMRINIPAGMNSPADGNRQPRGGSFIMGGGGGNFRRSSR